MLHSTLQKIGLSEKQAKIYIACLELGETSIKEIALKSDIKRTTIYDVIDEMVNSGFLKTTKKGKKIRYIAAEPDELKILIRQRESLLKEILPELNAISNVGEAKPKIWFYSGIEGVKKAYEDLLNYKDMTVYGWSSEDLVVLLGDEWIGSYIKRRLSRNIKEQLIYPSGQVANKYQSQDKKHERKSKIVDPKKYLFNIEINIYDNRVAMLSAKDKIGIIIESEPIVQTLKMIFKMCWDNI